MKKGTLTIILVFLFLLGMAGFWQYGSGTDVKIVDMHASPFGAGDLGQLDIVLQNNGSKPVDVWLDIENAFVDENGVSYSTPRLIISNNSTSPWDEGSVSLQKPINLLPGNNSVRAWLGYKLPGEYPVKVRVVKNSRLLDEETYPVNIPFPEIHLKLEYEMESKNTSDVYRIYGYLANRGLSSARNVSANLTVTNERTGELMLASSELYDVREEDKSPLWTWPDHPYAIVEIAHGKSSGESYMPVQNVVIGSNEDRFKVNVTVRWQDQASFAELLIPPMEEAR